jgi:hypothetical protein
MSVILVVAVIFLFLRSPRATFIPAIALPLSLVGTFGVMQQLGYALDNLSLMALTIATGFVVDDAIVMIENIVRYIEQGMRPLAAAYRGAAQIGFTIVSLTVSLIAVFIPLLFMGGVVGRLFKEFAVTLSVAVVVSAAISLTLTPMMCSRILRAAGDERPGRIARVSEAGFNALLGGYRRSLAWTFGHQTLVLLIGVGTLVGTIGLYVLVPKGFCRSRTRAFSSPSPRRRRGSIPRLVALQTQVVQIVERDPAVTGVVSFVGAGTINATPNTGRLTIALKPISQRDSAKVVIARMERAIAGIAGITAFFQPVQDIQIGTRISRTQFQYTLIDTDPAELALWAPQLQRRLAGDPALTNVATDQQNDGFRTYIDVDRDAAMRLGVSIQAVEDTLYDAFGQRQISTIFGQANQYRVVLEAVPSWQADPNSLRLLRVPGTGGAQVPLSGIATITRTVAPLVVTHQEQFPSVTLSFDLAPGYSLGEAVRAITAAEKAIGMPETISGSYSGDAAEFQKSLAAEPWLILAAVVVIYIVLGVLYESWIHPITILSTLPSAGIGALLALMIVGIDLSLVALVGIVLLMGIVKKNAIMMVDFAIEAERTRGVPRGRDPRGVPAAFPPDHDDDDGGAVGSIAADPGARRGIRAAFAPRDHHHRRPAAEPVPDAVPRRRSIWRSSGCGHGLPAAVRRWSLQVRPPPVIASAAKQSPSRWLPRCAPRNERGPARLSHGLFRPFIARPVATILLAIGLLLSARRLPLPADLRAPERRHPHHRGDRRAPGAIRRPWPTRRCATGTPARRNLRRHRNHLHQLDRQYLGRGPVRHRPRHQRRGARRAGGDQCGDHRSAVRPSHAALLSQVQSGRCADHDAGALVGHADHGTDL